VRNTIRPLVTAQASLSELASARRSRVARRNTVGLLVTAQATGRSAWSREDWPVWEHGRAAGDGAGIETIGLRGHAKTGP